MNKGRLPTTSCKMTTWRGLVSRLCIVSRVTPRHQYEHSGFWPISEPSGDRSLANLKTTRVTVQNLVKALPRFSQEFR